MSDSKGSIVVVEDEPLISMMIEDMAEELGWKVAGTANTEALALGLLETQRPTLAVLDIQLQQTTSLRVAEACRRHGIPVVFTTGYTVSGIAFDCGDAPILAKPFSSEGLSFALQRALDQKQGESLSNRRKSALTTTGAMAPLSRATAWLRSASKRHVKGAHSPIPSPMEDTRDDLTL